MHLLTYVVTNIDARGIYTVIERDDGVAVNEYRGYENNGLITLYPHRKLIPSSVLLDKKVISIQNTKRGF